MSISLEDKYKSIEYRDEEKTMFISEEIYHFAEKWLEPCGSN